MRATKDTPNAHRMMVHLNGERVNRCLVADDDEGFVIVDDNGSPKRLTGRVEIKLDEPRIR